MQSNFKINLFEISFLDKLVKKPFFPYIFQFVALVCLLILIINGLMTGASASHENETTFFYKRINLTTLIVWGIWWPGLILITILFGRIWCTICPMELVSNISNRLSKLTAFKGLKLNPFWVTGYIALFLYIVLQLLVAKFILNQMPLYTSYVLIGIILTATLAGLIFKDQRTFCKAFCPASLLLKVYNLFTPLVLRKKNDQTCSQCSSKDCISDAYINKLDARSCPGHIKPYNLNKNDDCINCFQCIKICPHNNLGVGISNRSFKEKTPVNLTLPVALFIFTALGFELTELLRHLNLNSFYNFPQSISFIINNLEVFPWLEALWFLFIIPITIFIIVKSFYLFDKNSFNTKQLVFKIALFILPVIATEHAVRALIKLNYWSRFLPEALSQLPGIH